VGVIRVRISGYYIFVSLTPTLSHKGRGSFRMETIYLSSCLPKENRDSLDQHARDDLAEREGFLLVRRGVMRQPVTQVHSDLPSTTPN